MRESNVHGVMIAFCYKIDILAFAVGGAKPTENSRSFSME